MREVRRQGDVPKATQAPAVPPPVRPLACSPALSNRPARFYCACAGPNSTVAAAAALSFAVAAAAQVPAYPRYMAMPARTQASTHTRARVRQATAAVPSVADALQRVQSAYNGLDGSDPFRSKLAEWLHAACQALQSLGQTPRRPHRWYYLNVLPASGLKQSRAVAFAAMDSLVSAWPTFL